jgi:hypothetical protein
MVQQLQGASPIAEVPVPASLHASLRPYQQQGLNWLQFLREPRAWAASWPTTWAWAKRCKRWPTSRSKKTRAASPPPRW